MQVVLAPEHMHAALGYILSHLYGGPYHMGTYFLVSVHRTGIRPPLSQPDMIGSFALVRTQPAFCLTMGCM